MDACTPVLGGLNRFQSIEFTDILEPLIDELPGAGPIGSHLAPVLPRAAARAVQHVLRTPGDGADAAVLMENAFTAGDTFFRPGGPLFEDTNEHRIESCIYRFVIPFGNRLDPGATAQRKDDIVSFDRICRLFYKNVITLPFNRQLFNLEREVLQPRGDAQRRCIDADFALPSGQADRDACAATQHEDLLLAFQYIDEFGDAFPLCYYHILISAFFDGFMLFNGLGPRFFRVASISLM